MSTQQQQLPFDGEARRLERVRRILGTVPKLTTGGRFFDYAEATRIAAESNRRASRG